MSELRRDPTSGGWVIIAPERNRRPQAGQSGIQADCELDILRSWMPLLSRQRIHADRDRRPNGLNLPAWLANSCGRQ